MLDPLLVSIADATRVIGVGKSKFYEIIAKRELSVIKLGRKSLIAVDDLRACVARLKSETP